MKSKIQTLYSGSKKSHIKLTELNTECLFLILEKLNIADLLSVSQTNKQFSVLAADVFRRRFASLDIEIVKDRRLMVKPFFVNVVDSILGNNALENEDKIPFEMSKHSIEVYDFELTLSLLKQFGNVIRNLNIHTQKLQSNHTEIINKFTDKYCAKSLVKLDLKFIRSKTLEQFTGPFNVVEDLSFAIDVHKIGSKTQPLNQSFPNIKRLSLFMVSDIDYSFIDCNYPRLEQLSVRGLHATRFETAVAMQSIISKNPQIRNIELGTFVPNLIKIVQKLLPKIEQLTLALASSIGNYKLHFEHVKVFALGTSGLPGQITFGKLEELHIYYSNGQSSAWVEFLEKHQNISRFHIRGHGTESDLHEQFERITIKIPNLKEMSIVSERMVEVNAVVRFIETHVKLMKFEIIPCTRDVKEILKRKFELQWNINNLKRDDRKGLLLRKKNIFN